MRWSETGAVTVTEIVTESVTESVTETVTSSEAGSEADAVMEIVAAFAAQSELVSESASDSASDVVSESASDVVSESASEAMSESASADAETVVAAAVVQSGPGSGDRGRCGVRAARPGRPGRRGVPVLGPAAAGRPAPRPGRVLQHAERDHRGGGAAAAKPQRRALKLAGRYALVLLTLGAIGAGTAYAVTLPKRTDIPTLKTKDDGRYQFPGLAKPRPAAGALGPSDKDNAHARRTAATRARTCCRCRRARRWTRSTRRTAAG